MPNDGNLAVLFPGQGSQTGDMRESVERLRPELVARIRAEVGEDAFERATESTRFAQPAIFCAALAGWERLRREPAPSFLAGHSLGELAALVAAGALDEDDGLRLVAARGRLMQEAAEAAPESGMLAVRAGRDSVQDVGERHGLSLANDNSPDQVVLSGASGGLAAAAEDLRAAGVRSKRLAVAGAFHSPLMEPAVAPFRELLEGVEVAEARLPVLSCVTAEPFDDVRERLAQAITHPVRWLDVMHTLRARGVRRLVETGPGRVLTGLVRRSLDGVEAEAPRREEAVHA